MDDSNEETMGFVRIIKTIFMHLLNPNVNSMDIWD